MTPEHTDMTGAARLREALEDLSFAKDRIENDWSCHGFHEDGCPRCEAHRRLSRAARGIREALAAVPEDPESQDDLLTITLRRGQWMVILGAASDYGKRVPLEQGDGGACLDAIREALGERVEEVTER